MFRRKNINIENLNALASETMAQHLGIEVVEIGEDHLVMKMPVDHRTIQPAGVLNGGASMALAETVGSLAGTLCLEEGKICVGQSITGNHMRPVRSGYVYGKATPQHLGRKTQVWEIRITNDEQKLICLSILTLAVIDL